MPPFSRISQRKNTQPSPFSQNQPNSLPRSFPPPPPPQGNSCIVNVSEPTSFSEAQGRREIGLLSYLVVDRVAPNPHQTNNKRSFEPSVDQSSEMRSQNTKKSRLTKKATEKILKHIRNFFQEKWFGVVYFFLSKIPYSKVKSSFP